MTIPEVLQFICLTPVINQEKHKLGLGKKQEIAIATWRHIV
jgi:hypothetical protein